MLAISRTVSMIDYVLRSAHVKSAKLKGEKSPDYKFTAQFLHAETLRQKKEIIRSKQPGKYAL
jgi:hypothetical protein